MVEAMVQLAHGLGMTPLAEGIETEASSRSSRHRVPPRPGVLFRASPARGRCPSLLARDTLYPQS